MSAIEEEPSFNSEELEISSNPAILDLQVVQFAAELEKYDTNKKIVAMARLKELTLDKILGRLFEVDASLAIGKSPDRLETTRIIYDQGIRFLGRAHNIGYMSDPNVPVSSVFIGFGNPTVIAAAEIIDEEVELGLYEAGAPSLSTIMAPILAIRACSVEM